MKNSTNMEDHARSILRSPISLGLYDSCRVSHVSAMSKGNIYLQLVGDENKNLHSAMARRVEDRQVVRPSFFELSLCNAVLDGEGVELANAMLGLLGFPVNIRSLSGGGLLCECKSKPTRVVVDTSGKKEERLEDTTIQLHPCRVPEYDSDNQAVIRYGRFLGKNNKRLIFFTDNTGEEVCLQVC